jgi:hypothetical protein
MANWTSYFPTVLLADFEVSKIGAGVEVTANATGTTTPSSATQVTIPSVGFLGSAIDASHVAEATYAVISSPIDSEGTMPDVRISFALDDKDQKGTLLLDGQASSNMMPDANSTVGEKRIYFGQPLIPYLKLLAKSGRLEGTVNLPMQITALKYRKSIVPIIYSAAGWGQNGAAINPLRIRVYGKKYNVSQLAEVAALIPSTMPMQLSAGSVAPFVAPYMFNVSSGSFDANAFTALPGGPDQGVMKVTRFFRYARNGQATSISTPFVLSNREAVGGQQNNIANSSNDLGFIFSGDKDALWVQEIGLRLENGAQGTFGWRVGGESIPAESTTTYGTPVSYNANPFLFGNVQPARSSSNLYTTMKPMADFFPLLVHRTDAAPFVSTQGTAVIEAGDLEVAVGGIYIERV